MPKYIFVGVLLILIRIRLNECYNLAGSYCHGKLWEEWQQHLWNVASFISRVRDFPEAEKHMSAIDACPEGVASALLGIYAQQPAKRASILGTIAEITHHFNQGVLLWRLRQGGWPCFGAAWVLEKAVVRYRFPHAGKLMLATSPRFSVTSPPAPERVLPGWWWSLEAVDIQRMQIGGGSDTSSIDYGMQILLQKTPLLTSEPKKLLIDVGAFDGTSLLSTALEVNMGHYILAFEPSAQNRILIAETVSKHALGQSVRILDTDTKRCRPILDADMRPHYSICKCSTEGHGCAWVANAGLFAADENTTMNQWGALSSVGGVSTHGGTAVAAPPEMLTMQPARLRSGTRIVQWWVNAILGRTCVDIHLVKIDVEGSEFAALKGLERLFADHRVRFLFLEFWPTLLIHFGTDPLAVLAWLAYYGFVCRFLHPLRGPETFQRLVQRHMTVAQMSDFLISCQGETGDCFSDLLCEDLSWADPCSDSLEKA